MRRRFLLKAALATTALPVVSPAATPSTVPIRGLVIEHTDVQRTAMDWQAVAREAQARRYTDVFITTTYTGGCHYESEIPALPRWASSLPENGGAPLPEAPLRFFAPLGITVHAVINCFNAQYGVTNESLAALRHMDMLGLLYHPERQTREEQVPWGGAWQRYLNYNNPRTGDRLAAIIRELLQRFPELGGIHLDYLRSPGWVAELSDFTLERYGASDWRLLLPDFFGGLNEERAAFDDWQRVNLSATVRKAVEAAGDHTLSASVFPTYYDPRDHHQPWDEWTSYFDYLCPMNYTDSNVEFNQRLRQDRTSAPEARIVPAIAMYKMNRQQAQAAREYAQSYLDYRLSYMDDFLGAPRAPTLL